MKKITERILLALLLFVSPVLTGCDNLSEDEDVTFFPLQVAVTAQDTAGSDLLAPTDADNINRLKGVILTYNGTSYKIGNLANFGIVEDQTSTRASLPIVFSGLNLTQYTASNGVLRYALVFGYLDGARNYDGETFTVSWPSGEVDVLEYWRQIEGNNIKEWATLNGEEVQSLTITRTFQSKNLTE